MAGLCGRCRTTEPCYPSRLPMLTTVPRARRTPRSLLAAGGRSVGRAPSGDSAHRRCQGSRVLAFQQAAHFQQCIFMIPKVRAHQQAVHSQECLFFRITVSGRVLGFRVLPVNKCLPRVKRLRPQSLLLRTTTRAVPDMCPRIRRGHVGRLSRRCLADAAT